MGQHSILVADDDRGTKLLLKGPLESAGYIVHLASTGEEAIQMIRSNPPTLVVTDIVMPDVDGYTLLTLIKNEPACKNIPVIILSMKGLESEAEKGLSLGAADYIVKPIHPPLLIKRIQNILGK